MHVGVKRPVGSESRQRLVIVALDMLGDLVLRQPLLSALVDCGYRVTVLTRPSCDELLPYLDSRLDTLAVDINPYTPPDDEAWTRLAAASTRIQQLKPTVVVAAAYNRTYADEWLLHQSVNCETVGYTNPDSPPSVPGGLLSTMRAPGARREVLFTNLVSCAIDEAEPDKHRALFRAITGTDLPERRPQITISHERREDAARMLRAWGLAPGQFAIGCPAGTTSIPLKAWPPAEYADLVQHLHERHGLPVLLVGSPSEDLLLQDVARITQARGVRARVWIGGPGALGTLLGLIAHSRLYLGNDTGPMHCAAALDVPVVARFGGAHWPRFLPLARRSFSATQQLPCFGCDWHCSLGQPACLTMIRTQTFADGLDWVLASADEARRVHTGQPLDANGWSAVKSTAMAGHQLRADASVITARAAAPAVVGPRRPKVFVVTPSFNQGRFLRETIESVLSQDHGNLEYVIADGGSTDGSVDVLRSYGNRFRWTSGPDGGQSAAIARAWRETDADIVAWLDSDDTYLPGAISAAAGYLLAHPETSMVYGQAWHTTPEGQRSIPYPTKPFDRAALAKECFICQPAAFVRRDVLTVVDPPDPALRYSMDYDFWIRLAQYFRIDYLETFLATKRAHADGKSVSQRDGMLRESIAVAERHFGAVDSTWIFAHAQYKWERLLRQIPLIPAAMQPRLLALIAERVRADRPGRLDDDSWAGRRTLMTVESDAEGNVRLDCECSPHLFPLSIGVSWNGLPLVTTKVERPGRFALAFTVPEHARPIARVLLEANRSFIPLLRDLNEDPRSLSFRIFGQVASGPGPDAGPTDRPQPENCTVLAPSPAIWSA